jgi:oxygen-dependent protoporphyrinogen oxidase
LAGLTAARELSKSGAEVTLYEPSPRLGGKILTERVDGFLIEGGPDSLISYKPAAAELCAELGLEKEIVPASSLPTLLFSGGRLERLPEGASLAPTNAAAFLASPLLSWRGKLRTGLDLVLPRRKGGQEESLARFVTRRFGREFYERWAEPLLSGVYGGNPEELSLQSTFPRLAELESKHGSVIRGLSAASGRSKGPVFWTLSRGLSSLVEALEKELGKVRLVRERVQSLEGLSANRIILATPAYVSAGILRKAAPEAARLLDEIPYGDAATAAYGFQGVETPKASGFLVPRAERRSILGATFSSNKYPGRAPEGAALARVYFGGTGDWNRRSDEDLAELGRSELAEIAGIRARPAVTRVYRWPRAMPQYRVGHAQRLARIEAALPPEIVLAGSAYRGVGLSDCIVSGRKAAEISIQSAPAVA